MEFRLAQCGGVHFNHTKITNVSFCEKTKHPVSHSSYVIMKPENQKQLNECVSYWVSCFYLVFNWSSHQALAL